MLRLFRSGYTELNNVSIIFGCDKDLKLQSLGDLGVYNSMSLTLMSVLHIDVLDSFLLFHRNFVSGV
jgi:hypothetical protein